MRIRTAALLTAGAMLQPVPVPAAAEDGFFEDFSGTRLDSGRWLIAEKNWGGTVTENGVTSDYNGGVLAENVSVADGNLILTGYGNQYEGDVRGINRDGTRRADGKRCGAAIATREYFGSGSYEIRAKIAPELGCCSAMWTFEYEEDYSGDTLQITNHEIDIEFPGRNAEGDFSLYHALCTTWVTEEDYRTESVDCGAQADGAFHTYRFDWHTGSDTQTPRVEYYFDDVLCYTADAYIPTNASRFWLGLWFPKHWAGTPDFDTASFVIDYAKFTPFHESGDTPQHESYPDHGWAEVPADLPRGWLLWHSYTSYAALDSRLYLRLPDGTVTEITGDFRHAMNGSFGRSPSQFTFMAIDPAADEWDIFLWDAGSTRNLTPESGFRNEDPKLSPDGRRIVFKRGKWDQAAGDFVYQLAMLDLETGTVTMLTDDSAEEAMPCFSADGNAVYYTRYTDGIGAIMRMENGQTETVFAEAGVNAYYPVVQGDLLYFTRWESAQNHCDRILCYDGAHFTEMPFDSPDYDCSDACPVGAAAMIYSSTAKGSYDLYYYDGTHAARIAESSAQNDLGAAFFAQVRGDVNCDGRFGTADVILMQQWLVKVPGADLTDPAAGDMNADGGWDVLDLALMKHELIRKGE